MGLLDGTHARALREAQNLWDRGRQAEAIGLLDAVVPDLWPRMFATDALILATLAGYVSECGDPKRGLKLLEAVGLDERPRTDIQAICLGARCCCRAAAGDVSGAQNDRSLLFKAQPSHPALLPADEAIRLARRALMARAVVSLPREGAR